VIRFIVPAGRDAMIREYLAVWGRNLADRIRVLHYETLVRQSSFEPGTYVLSSLDELTPAVQRLVGELHGELARREGYRLLNDPAGTLRRFDLLAELRRRRFNEFGAVRAVEDLSGLSYPVFLREERSHDGAVSPLLHSPSEVEARIGLALVQGYRLGELLVVEFCDTADGNGFYRKYAAFVVGKRVVARSLNYGRQWMLKQGGTEFSREMVLEENDYVSRNPHEAQLKEIFEVAGVEYGRIDYALKDGRVQTWEINLNPTIGRGTRPSRGASPRELEPIRTETKSRFYASFQEAWESVDLPADGRPAVRVALDPRTIQAARSEHVPRGRRLNALRAALRPARSALEPLAAPFFPLLGRLARKAAARRL
jgi:hypothetical protein